MNPEGLVFVKAAGELPRGALEPEGSGWNPEVPVESEDSGERPKMLVSVRRCSVGCFTHWGTEVLRCTVSLS